MLIAPTVAWREGKKRLTVPTVTSSRRLSAVHYEEIIAFVLLDYGDLVRMCDPGKDIFTVALDVLMPESFDRTRGGVDSPHQWDKYWRTDRMGRGSL